MGAQRFEELIAWQKARVLAGEVYFASRAEPFCRDFSFCRQIRDAAVSVMANVAEGYGRHSPREFAHFLSIAYSSCAEVRSHLYIAFDIGYLDEGALEPLLTLNAEVARLTSGLRTSVLRQLDSS